MAVLTQKQLNAIAAQNAAYFKANPQEKANVDGGYTPYVAPAVSTLPTTQTVSNQSLGITAPAPAYTSSMPTGQTVTEQGIEIYSPSTGEVKQNWTGPVPFGWHSRPMSATQQTQDQGQQGGLPPFETLIEELAKRGISVNSNITEITPELVAEFLKKAENEIAPVFAARLKVARDNILRQFGYAKEEVELNERRLEQKYGKDVRQLGESAAERGFAQSGIRQLEEQDLAQQTQNTIDDRRRELSFEASNQAGQFAGQYGTLAVPQLPGLGSAPRVLSGQGTFDRPGGTSPFYSLSNDVYDGLKGQEQFTQEAAIRGRVGELKSDYREEQADANLRKLII